MERERTTVPDRKPLRFGLRTLLLTVVVVAAALGLVRTWPAWYFEHSLPGAVVSGRDAFRRTATPC